MTFEKLVKNWVNEIQSLKETMLINQIVNTKQLQEVEQSYYELIKTKCIVVNKKSENSFTFEIPDSVYSEFYAKRNERNKLIVATNIFPRMYIVTLICQYDALIGNLVKLVLFKQTELLNNSEKTMSFQQLMNYEKMEDVKEYIIEKEIESILRESHDEQLKWFEKKLNIKLHEDKELIKNFLEITERRNLFTHNNAKVNESYLANCKKMNIDTSVKIGDVLEVSPEYYKKSVNCIIEIGTKLAIILWRHLYKDDYERSEIVLNQIAYGLIYDYNYELAEKLLDFALNSFKPFKASSNKLMITLNKAQCMLWEGKETEVKNLLNEQDWSLCTPQFLLCKTVLERKFDNALEILKTKDTELSQSDLLSWPIFKELREEENFKKFMNEKYPKKIENCIEENSNKLELAEQQLAENIS